MSNVIHKTFVFGQDIATMDANGLIASIKAAKAEIAALKATDVESEYINKSINDLEQAISTLVAALDEK